MERRALLRKPVFIVAEMKCAGRNRVALCRDATEKSILLGCSRSLPVGAKVDVSLGISGAAKHPVTGRIVRCDRNTQAEISLWRYFIAIELDEADPALQRFLSHDSAAA